MTPTKNYRMMMMMICVCVCVYLKQSTTLWKKKWLKLLRGGGRRSSSIGGTYPSSYQARMQHKVMS